MKRTVTNAFTLARSGGRNPRGSLAGSLCPLQARLEETNDGFRLEMSPMMAIDAAAAWARCDAVTSDEPDALDPDAPDAAPNILLFDAEPSGWNGPRADEPLAVIADRLELPVIERFGEDCIVVDDDSLAHLLAVVRFSRLRAIRIDGPIEPRDARAMVAAVDRGESPLSCEIRALGMMTFIADRAITLYVRERARGLALVAENLRHYLAAICNEPVRSFATIAPDELTAWLRGGSVITIRPIETRVYASFIDIGVSTTPSETPGPAECSLIYDRPSHSWHGEE
jgi:hypothetical protein